MTSWTTIFVRKVAGRPVGIWIAWIGLIYVSVAEWRGAATTSLPNAIVLWPILMAAAISLMRRKFITTTLSGMALVIMLRDTIAQHDWIGITIAPVAFIALLANRRWFDDKLPRIE